MPTHRLFRPLALALLMWSVLFACAPAPPVTTTPASPAAATPAEKPVVVTVDINPKGARGGVAGDSTALEGNADDTATGARGAPIEPKPGTAVPVTGADPSWGDPLAPVTMVVWGNYECPFTARLMTQTLPKLYDLYGPKRLRFVWKHNPLPFHKNARPTHLAAETVLRLGGPKAFWLFHKRAFENQQALTAENLEAWAVEAGIGPSTFRAAIESEQFAAKIDRDLAAGKAAGVTGTPASILNGVFLSGAQPLERFQGVIEEQEKAAEELRRQGVPPELIYAKLSEKNRANAPSPASKPASPPPDTTTVWRVPVEKSPVRGPRTALVTLVMFGDFQCPFCKKAAPTVEGLMAKYGDKLRFIYKYKPLPFHARAEPAAELAVEARAQKGDAGFWKAYKLLTESSSDLSDAELLSHATSLGLNVAKVKQAIASKRHSEVIGRDEDLADDLQATGTPHFFINGRRLTGTQPAEKFEAIIDEEIKRAEKLLAAGAPPAGIYEALQKDAKGPPPPTRIIVPAATKENPGKGAPLNAKVTVQMFADFECPFCKRVKATIDELMAAYPGKVRVVFRHLPLPMHKNAGVAAEASVEAFRQRGDAGFWAMADSFFKEQENGPLSRDKIEKCAAAVGLDMAKLKAALDAGTHRATVEAEATLAHNLGISGTPAFAINDYYLSGAQSLRSYKRLVDKALGPHEPIAPGSLHSQRRAVAPSPAPSGVAPSPSPSAQAAPSATQALFGAKHLLIMYVGSRRAPATVTRTRDEALKLAQQVFKMATSGAAFESLVAQYSDEPGAAARGGDLGRFPKGAMVPEFQSAVENLKVGAIGLAESPFGFHVILRTQ